MADEDDDDDDEDVDEEELSTIANGTLVLLLDFCNWSRLLLLPFKLFVARYEQNWVIDAEEDEGDAAMDVIGFSTFVPPVFVAFVLCVGDKGEPLLPFRFKFELRIFE